MRVLFVTPYIPSLIRPRALNFVKQLSRDHDVTLVSLAVRDPGEGEALEVMKRCCERVHVLPLSKVRAATSCGLRLLTPMPLQAAYTCSPSWNHQIAMIAESGGFDVLHVEHIRGAHLAELVQGLPRVYDSVDCITRLLKQRLSRPQGFLQRMLNREELAKMRWYEPKVARMFDRVVITSEHDKRALATLMDHTTRIKASPGTAESHNVHRSIVGGARSAVTVVPNGVDSEYFHPQDVRPQSNTIVFSGKMGYFANVSAVLRFYHEVLPLIRRAKDDVKFKVVGSDPPHAIRELASDPAVEVTGYVRDIRPHLASAAVITCPLTIGVGIQNKVLESMSMGKPVVTSALVCHGIPDAVSGDHLVCADDPSDVARQILRLLENSSYGAEIGRRAHRLVKENYSWESAVRSLVDVYGEALNANRDRVPTAA